MHDVDQAAFYSLVKIKSGSHKLLGDCDLDELVKNAIRRHQKGEDDTEGEAAEEDADEDEEAEEDGEAERTVRTT
jgi:hypothetical protein